MGFDKIEYKLEELFELEMGKTPSRNNPEYWNNGDNKWISIGDLSKCGKYICETKECLSNQAVEDSGIRLIPENTVVMSFKLSIGKTAITKTSMYSNEAIMSFRDRGIIKLIPDYVYYMFRAKNWEEGTNKAVMGKTLNKATLSKIKIRVCDVIKQYEIVEVLDKVSSMIESRKEQLEELDTLIKARFVEMFGDPIYNTLKLKTKPMTDLCEIIDGDRGKNYPTVEEFSEEGYCLFLNAKNVTVAGFNFETCMFITKEKDEILRKGKLQRGDVVLTTRGTIGNMAFYTDEVPYEHIRINSGMVVLRMHRDEIDEVYFIEQFKMQLADIKEKIANGSAQPQLPISTMNKIQVLLPDINAQKQFSAFVTQLDKSKVAIQKSLTEMQTLFDSLMQQYFG